MRTHQAIVIGAGVNGLAAALNLASAGIKTVVIERSGQIGGQAITEEALLPGFKLHPHANYLSYQTLLDRQSNAASLTMPRNCVMPMAQHGLAFRDGRPPVLVYRRELLQKTKRSMATFSRHDARAFEQAKSLADRLTRPLANIYFSPPYADTIQDYVAHVAQAYAGLFDSCQLGSRSAQQIIDSLFESDEVRTMFYRLTLEFSGNLLDPGGDIGFLGHVLWLLGRRTLPLGGMGNIPQALANGVRAAGAEIVCGIGVEKISAPAGVVDGVWLSDGSFVSATLVLSSTDYATSMSKMVHGSEKQEFYDGVQAHMIGSYSACLAAAPLYCSGLQNEDINKCAQVFIGLDSSAEVIEQVADLAAGRLPAPSGAIRLNTLWDPTQAPAGMHSGGADCPFPGGLDAQLVTEIEASFPSAFAATWADYAPNLHDSILAQRVMLSSDRTRKIALREGDSQYRGPLHGYYLCGASTHPGGGIHGACGVNAVEVIFRDLKCSA